MKPHLNVNLHQTNIRLRRGSSRTSASASATHPATWSAREEVRVECVDLVSVLRNAAREAEGCGL